MLAHSDPATARRLLESAQLDVAERWRLLEHWAALPAAAPAAGEGSAS
jgi:hypothetical protein